MSGFALYSLLYQGSSTNITIPVYASASKLSTLANAKLERSLIIDNGINTIAASGRFTKARNSALFVNETDAPIA